MAFYKPMKLPRLTDWTLIAAGFTLVIALVAPQQLGVTAYKLSLVSLAAVFGYWIDRSLFPYARPEGCSHDDRPAAMIRRALVVAACIIGVSLGA
jgi:hypothetical protein